MLWPPAHVGSQELAGVWGVCFPGLRGSAQGSSFLRSPTGEIPPKETRNCLLLKLFPYVLFTLKQICVSDLLF